MISIRFEENQDPDSNPLIGPIETFTLRDTGSGLEVTPFKPSTYFLAAFLFLAATFIFYMSLDSELKDRPFVRVLLWAMGLCALYCAYRVYKKGSGMLRFNQGGHFIEYLDGDGSSHLIQVPAEGLRLIQEAVTPIEGQPYDQFRLLAGPQVLLMTKKLETINKVLQRIENYRFLFKR